MKLGVRHSLTYLATSLAIDAHFGGNAAVTALTFNGDALTLIGARSNGDDSLRIESWGLVNPDVGTHAIAVTLSAAVNSVTCGTLYSGVYQEAPTEAFDSDAAVNPGPAEVDAELTITSVTDECNIHSAIVTEDPSVISNQTSRNNVAGAGGSAVQADVDDNLTPPGTRVMSCA